MSSNDFTVEELRTRWETVLDANDEDPDKSLRPDDAPGDDGPLLAGVRLRQRSLEKQSAAAADPDDTVAVAPPDADFEIGDTLGRGGMGLVFRARQTALNRAVAVKAILPEQAAVPETRRKFVAEAVVTGSLDHPNIVPVHDLGLADDIPFYAMKEVKGEPWNTLLPRLSEVENLDILLKVGDAVAFAHDHGVLHRDIKPANVMVGDHGEVLLMDWGIAVATTPEASRYAEALSPANARAGTPAYMAPEMAAGQREKIGVASDIYLMGGILYEIATGLKPHAGATTIACIYQAARGEIQQSERRDDLVYIALRALAREPEQRFASVAEMLAVIREHQIHRDSIAMARAAGERLENATDASAYDDYARALFGFEEALRLWPRNGTALNGAAAARLRYATQAAQRGDYDLARSLALPLSAEALAADLRNAAPDRRVFVQTRNHLWKAPAAKAERLLVRIEEGSRRTRARLRRERFLFWGAAALAALVVLGTLGAYLGFGRRGGDVEWRARLSRVEESLRQAEKALEAAKTENTLLRNEKATAVGP